MYPITSAVKALFDSEQRQVLRITGTDRNGAAISITEANVMMDGFNIDRYACNGEKLEIGTAVAAEMSLTLDNREGQYDGIVFEGAELFVEIGIADWEQENPTVAYIPCGYFTPDTQPRNLSTITLNALDRMVKFDAAYPTLTNWTTDTDATVTDGSGEAIQFTVSLELPATIADVVAQIADACGVPFAQDLTGLPNHDYTVTELPSLQQRVTCRGLIQWCAGIMGANAWIDWTGALRFSWYGEDTGYVTTVANRFSEDLHESDIVITGVTYTNTQDATLVSGTDDYALDMTGNYLAASGIGQILPAVKNAVAGFTYRPFSAEVVNAPYLWPMDMITFTDRDGNDHDCAVTNVNFGINGLTALKGVGETEQINSGVKGSGLTNEQAFMIEMAAENVRQLDESLTQQEVFNRLTDNGAAQGIYLQDGKLYINGTYMQIGTIRGADGKNYWVLDGDDPIFVVENGRIGAFTLNDQELSYEKTILGMYTYRIRLSGSGLRTEYENGETGDTNATSLYGGDVYFFWNGARKFAISCVEDYLFIREGDGDYTYPLQIYGPGYAGIPSEIVTDYNLTVHGDLSAGNGASGSFTTADGKTVTVANGIITGIS